jgi:hypothetical protein
MSTSTPNISEAAIRQVAEKTIASTMEAHGLSDRSQLKDEVIQSAYDYAKEKLTAEAEQAADPNYQRRKALEEENRTLKMQLEAVKSSRSASPDSTTSSLDPDIVARKLGPAVWNHSLDANGRLQACGINPSINTPAFRAEIKQYFGPGSSSMDAAELARTNHGRYKLLKNAGKALRII